jgi:aminomethyltransferase
MKTPLYDKHCALGAKMVGFNGWEMPLQYKGIVHEHNVVRNAVGLFDVSHMGRVLISGLEAERFLEILSTNQIAGRPDFSATYTVWCTLMGGSVDDGLVYRINRNQFFVVVNAGNRVSDLVHFQMAAEQFNVTIESHYDLDGILALQGPKAGGVLNKVFEGIPPIAKKHFIETSYKGHSVAVARTGYTGEDGYEIMGPQSAIVALWDALLEAGKPEGIEPVGLGARDTLRLEMGYALYGHELNPSIAPIESVAAWTVKWDKPLFIGKQELEKLNHSPKKRWAYGVILADRAVPREGCKVLVGGQEAGIVTSGGFAPSLNASVALILVHQELTPQQRVDIVVRDQPRQGKCVPLPFYQHMKV